MQAACEHARMQCCVFGHTFIHICMPSNDQTTAGNAA